MFDCDSKLTNVCFWLSNCKFSKTNFRNDFTTKSSNESSRCFFDCKLSLKNSVMKFEVVNIVLNVNIDDDLLCVFRWIISKKKNFELSETIKFEVSCSNNSRTNEWFDTVEVFSINNEKSTMSFSKKTIVRVGVLKINTKKRTSLDRNRERYFFLIEVVDDVDVLFVLSCKKFELFFAAFSVSSYFLNSIWKLLICLRNVDLNVNQLLEYVDKASDECFRFFTTNVISKKR